MRRNPKYLQIISNILLLIVVILLLINQNKFLNNLYWVLIPLTFLANVFYINKWSKDGEMIIKNIKEKEIKYFARKKSEVLLFSLIIFTLIYLSLLSLEYFIETIKINPYVIVGFYLLTILFELFIIGAVSKTKKEIRALINNK